MVPNDLPMDIGVSMGQGMGTGAPGMGVSGGMDSSGLMATPIDDPYTNPCKCF